MSNAEQLISIYLGEGCSHVAESRLDPKDLEDLKELASEYEGEHKSGSDFSFKNSHDAYRFQSAVNKMGSLGLSAATPSKSSGRLLVHIKDDS